MSERPLPEDAMIAASNEALAQGVLSGDPESREQVAEQIVQAALPHLPGLSALTDEEIEALLVQTGGYSEAIRRTASVVHGHTQSVRAKLRAELSRRRGGEEA